GSGNSSHCGDPAPSKHRQPTENPTRRRPHSPHHGHPGGAASDPSRSVGIYVITTHVAGLMLLNVSFVTVVIAVTDVVFSFCGGRVATLFQENDRASA